MSTLYCPQCGYNLTGLTEGRCPECGTSFDRVQLALAQQKGLMTGGKLAANLLAMPLAFAAVWVVLLFFLAFAAVGLRSSEPVFIIFLLVGLLWLVALVVCHARYVARRFVATQRLRAGGHELIGARGSVPLWTILFTLAELTLGFSYWIGGCACMLGTLGAL